MMMVEMTSRNYGHDPSGHAVTTVDADDDIVMFVAAGHAITSRRRRVVVEPSSSHRRVVACIAAEAAANDVISAVSMPPKADSRRPAGTVRPLAS